MPGRSVGGGHRSSSHRSSSHRSSSHRSSSHRSSSHHRSSYHHHSSSYYNHNSNTSNNNSSGIIVIIVLIAIILFSFISTIDEYRDYEDYYGTNSIYTGSYEKINTSPSVHKTEYIEDNANVIKNPKDVIYALRYFESKTGICPVLVTEKYFYGRTEYDDESMEKYVVQEYNKRFNDEEHMLFYFFTDVDKKGVIWGETGSKADKYMDSYAWDVLFDEIEKYLLEDNPQQAFTKGFINTADKLSKSD